MRQKVYADVVNKWNVMVENARSIVASMGPAAERHQELAAHIQDLIRLNEQAEANRSQLSLVMEQRRELALAGARTYRRFTADLQAHHGLDSAELIRYGILPKGRPRKNNTKKKEVEEEAAKAKAEAGKVQVEVAPA